MAKPSSISDLFTITNRFMRSVQLERDFGDPGALDHYVVTPDMALSFQRVADGLATTSTQRAWRITGDYGVGKSSFALVLAHLLSNPTSPGAARIAQRMAWPQTDKTFWPFLVTGSRENLVSAMARGLREGLERRRPKPSPKQWGQLLGDAEEVEQSGDPARFEALLKAVRKLADDQGAGVVLIIDELGKLFEYAASEPGRDDIFILQKLGELAQGSGATPFFMFNLLHQGIDAYAARLPSATRLEWAKVAERFDEIVFDQPMAHTATLVAGALGLKVAKLPPAVRDAAKQTASATASMGWMSGATSAALMLETAQIYPVHPTLLPPLVRFFSQFGQNERTLFGFLLSSEPFGLQRFAEQIAGPDVWYGLPEFYDFVRSAFGHRLSGNSYQSNWLRIAATVDTAQDLSATELGVLKAVAILSLLDSADLLATDAALEACLSPAPARDVVAAIATLVDRGLLFRHGQVGGYRLWPNTSVNLYAELQTARRALGSFESVAAHLESFLEHDPILARRHYIDHGTMRYFEVRYATPDRLEEAAGKPSQADGVILIGFADTAAEREAIDQQARNGALADRSDLIVGVLKPLQALSAEVQDLKSWQWVSDNTPELRHDAYAAAEVARQLATASRALNISLGVTAALRTRGATSVTWIHEGVPVEVGAGLSSVLSDICDERFRFAPKISNELLNRKLLSSPAAAARMRLIEALFAAPDQYLFGIDPLKAPPEKSMFLSVIKRGGLQREVEDRFELCLPTPDDDPLNLYPAFSEIERILEKAQGGKVPVRSILEALAEAPYGVRSGVSPLLLAIVLKHRAHDLAVYEHGTFRAAFDGPDFVRLVKGPDAFEFQLCRLEGVRADVFARLAEAFTGHLKAEDPKILDVVQTLCQFAARLPEYTRKAGTLAPRTVKVRDALLSATEPSTLLFSGLPLACGLAAFTTLEDADPERTAEFVRRLQEALEDLRSDYPRLLTRIQQTVSASISLDDGPLDRPALAHRAALVFTAATLPKLKAFANRLRDVGTHDDAWTEAVASYLVAKPPARWNGVDEQRCLEELASLSELFHRVDAAAFGTDKLQPDRDAVLIKLTHASGAGRVHVVRKAALGKKAQAIMDQVNAALGDDKAQRLQILSALMWEDLPVEAEATEPLEGLAQSRAGSV